MTLRRSVVLAAAVLLTFALAACGGGGGGGTASTPPPPTPGSAAVTVNMGDTGSERIVAFHQDITAVKMKTSSTDTAGEDGVSATRHVEFTHLSGTMEPVEIHKSINADKTYTEAEVRFANTKISCLDNTGVVRVKTVPDDKFTVPLSNVKLTNNSNNILNFDLDLTKVSADDTCTNVTLATTGAMVLRSNNTIPQTENEEKEDAEKGELEHIAGKITAVTANTFTLQVGQSGMSMTFGFDSTTKLDDGLTAITAAQVGTVVKVEGITKPDGSLFAKEVEGAAEGADALEAEGLVTSKGATDFVMTVHDGIGTGVAGSLGQTVTVTVGAGTAFKISQRPGITLPAAFTFGSFADLAKGQHVEVDNDAGIVAAAVTAKKVKLVQQTIRGQVTAVGGPLTLGVTGTQFALITGQTNLSVSLEASPVGASLAVLNANVRVRGFLFFNGGTYTLVATSIKAAQ